MILSGNDTVGSACVNRCGLYYHIVCKCELIGKDHFRIVASCDGKQVDLGVCVPIEGGFGLQTRIPVKRLGEGELCFKVVSGNAASSELFIPVSESEPFLHLSMLDTAYLVKRNGQTGVCLQTDSSKPTGQ